MSFPSMAATGDVNLLLSLLDKNKKIVKQSNTQKKQL